MQLNELIFETIPLNKKFKDLTGQIFGRLRVIGFAGYNKYKHLKWYVHCECNNITTVIGTSLKAGLTQSCGCLHKEKITEPRKKKHGYAGNNKRGSRNPTYSIWASMLARCNNSKNYAYNDYGGRGIYVCKEWYDFKNFLEDMGERPEGLTLDRKENDKGYYKENCRWATYFTQANNRRNNCFFTYNGETKSISQWATQYSIRDSTLRARLARGWSIEKALKL